MKLIFVNICNAYHISSNQRVSLKDKGRVYAVLVLTILLHGSESWSLRDLHVQSPTSLPQQMHTHTVPSQNATSTSTQNQTSHAERSRWTAISRLLLAAPLSRRRVSILSQVVCVLAEVGIALLSTDCETVNIIYIMDTLTETAIRNIREHMVVACSYRAVCVLILCLFRLVIGYPLTQFEPNSVVRIRSIQCLFLAKTLTFVVSNYSET